jgi:hypothetical protein
MHLCAHGPHLTASISPVQVNRSRPGLGSARMNFQFNPSSGYAIVTCGLITVFVLFLITCVISRWIASLISHAILRYLVYSTISLFNLPDYQIPVNEMLFAIAYISANAVCIGWNVKSTQELSSRCSSLLVTNLIVLLPGASIAANILQMSFRGYQRAHSIVGVLALVEGSVHAALELLRHGWKGGAVAATGLAVSTYWTT